MDGDPGAAVNAAILSKISGKSALNQQVFDNTFSVFNCLLYTSSVPTNRLKGLVSHLLALHFVEHRLQVYPEFFGNTLSAPFIGLIETGHRTRLDIDRNTRHRCV